MSFSAAVKTELCRLTLDAACCRRAQCYGALLFARSFSERGIVLVTEHPDFGREITNLLAEECGVFVEMETKITHRRQSPESSTVQVVGDDQRLQVLGRFGHHAGEVQLHLHPENLAKRCCTAAFLRGVFLSCGTVINPEKEYHLEFTTPHHHLAEELRDLMASVKKLHLQPAILNRKGTYVVYLKDSDAIADLLTYMGAQTGALELIQVKMLKEVRNEVNRRSNCETANLTKTANAAAVQRIAIEKIMRCHGLEQLSPELQELAQLRYENPEMSLRELGENLSSPISRSGVNHRIQRLLEIAETLPDLEEV